MANKPKKSASSKASSTTSATKAETKVTRITASDDRAKTPKTASKKSASKKEVVAKEASAKKPTRSKAKKQRRNPLRAIGGYFKGAWVELRQVRWPNRRATWGMTLAVIGFTAFFVVLIVLLDAGFKYLFELILG